MRALDRRRPAWKLSANPASASHHGLGHRFVNRFYPPRPRRARKVVERERESAEDETATGYIKRDEVRIKDTSAGCWVLFIGEEPERH
jgi:hypothetical protein